MVTRDLIITSTDEMVCRLNVYKRAALLFLHRHCHHEQGQILL